MAPRPKTYGTRRSYAKPAGELVNGTTADEPELELRRHDRMSASARSDKEEYLGTIRIEGKQAILSKGLGKEDGPASSIPAAEGDAPSNTPNGDKKFTTVSSASGPLPNRRLSGQVMLPLVASGKERGSNRKSTRRLVNGSATSEDQNSTTKTDVHSSPIAHTSPSQAKANFRPNGATKEHQSPIGRNVDLKGAPSDPKSLAIWIAQWINKSSDKRPLQAMFEPKQKDLSSQHERDIEIGDTLDNLEGFRMTRGKERKRFQQLKGKGPADAIDLNSKFVDGVGESLQPKNRACIERRLKDDLNDKLKQKLFGSAAVTDMSTNVIEQNACGKLLFNALVDIGNSANMNSAAVLKSALEERQDDAPFLSALKILASSSEIIAFITFFLSKDNPSQRENSKADESRPSIGVETAGATAMTEKSGLTSHVGTSISDAEGLIKATTRNKAIDNQNREKQKRSREVIQALEAATTILLQIQQGEAGTGYITPYASGSMIPNPTGQLHMNAYGNTNGPPYPNHPAYGMAYGPPVGVNLSNYASPYANPLVTHPVSYASPYFNPVNQPPANYASPYANPVIPNQASGSGLVGSSHNQANKHDGHELRHDNQEALTPHQDATDVASQTRKGDDEATGRDVSNEEKDASKASKETNDQGVSNGKEEPSKACDKATGRGVSKENGEASNVVDLDETGLDDANKQDNISKDDETSSDDDLTDDELITAKTDSQNIAPPAEDHKLFTGERLGDFTSRENIDWLLTMGNGGKIPRPQKKTRRISPSRTSSFYADTKVETEVSRIINQIVFYKDWRGHPGGTPKHFFYASAEGQRLAAELGRLMAVAKPVVNTIVPLAESQARLRLYQQLQSRAIKEKRDREIQEGMSRYYEPPIQIQQWVPPPAGHPVERFPIPRSLPPNGPMEFPFVRRGNVIAAPPGGRNIEEEKKAETYGYPPMPGSRPGDSQQGQKRKRAARH